MYIGNNERCYVDEFEYMVENSFINFLNYYRMLWWMLSISKFRIVV